MQNIFDFYFAFTERAYPTGKSFDTDGANHSMPTIHKNLVFMKIWKNDKWFTTSILLSSHN